MVVSQPTICNIHLYLHSLPFWFIHGLLTTYAWSFEIVIIDGISCGFTMFLSNPLYCLHGFNKSSISPNIYQLQPGTVRKAYTT
jgi:hypothetical protein